MSTTTRVIGRRMVRMIQRRVRQDGTVLPGVEAEAAEVSAPPFSTAEYAAEIVRAGPSAAGASPDVRWTRGWCWDSARRLGDYAVDHDDMRQELALLALERAADLASAHEMGGMPLVAGRLRSLAKWQVVSPLNDALAAAYPFGPVVGLDRLGYGPNPGYVRVTVAMREVRDRVHAFALGPTATSKQRAAVLSLVCEDQGGPTRTQQGRQALKRAVESALAGDERLKAVVAAVRPTAVSRGGSEHSYEGSPALPCAIPAEALEGHGLAKVLTQPQQATLTAWLSGQPLGSYARRDAKRRALERLELTRRPGRWRQDLDEDDCAGRSDNAPPRRRRGPVEVADPVFEQVWETVFGCGRDNNSVGSGAVYPVDPPRPGLREAKAGEGAGEEKQAA